MIGNQSIRWATNGEMFLIQLDRETSQFFSAGRQLEFMGLITLVGEAAGVQLFGPTNLSAATSPSLWLEQDTNSTLLRDLHIDEKNEWLLVARNETVLCAAPTFIDADWMRLESLMEFVAALPQARPAHFDASNYPDGLKGLVPLIAHWGVGDDELRGDRIKRAPDRALKELADKTLPLLDEINAYLASVPPAHAESASLLDGLAQAALDADDELRNRGMAPPSN